MAAYEYRITASKPADPQAERARHAKVKEVTIDLCDRCVDQFWARMEAVVEDIKTLKEEKEEGADRGGKVTLHTPAK